METETIQHQTQRVNSEDWDRFTKMIRKNPDLHPGHVRQEEHVVNVMGHAMILHQSNMLQHQLMDGCLHTIIVQVQNVHIVEKHMTIIIHRVRNVEDMDIIRLYICSI